MTRAFSPGVFALVLLLFAGVWIVLAPFVLSIQPPGAHWLNSTISDVAVGGILIGVSLLGIVIHAALGLRDLVTAATVTEVETTGPEPCTSEQSGV